MLFAPGGTDAIGMAIKLARIATGRHKTVSMWDSFHGASLDAISFGGEAIFRRGIGPLLPGTEHVPPCDPRSCRFGCGGSCNCELRRICRLRARQGGDVAAVVVETVRSPTCRCRRAPTTSPCAAPATGTARSSSSTRSRSCLGRTGTMFAFERYGIVPDMVVLGKGLGGGVFPMAALLVREGLDVAGDRALGHYTHEKSSLGCAAALATIEVIESEGLLERATRLGARALKRLREMQARLPAIVEVRGVGPAARDRARRRRASPRRRCTGACRTGFRSRSDRAT